MDYKEIIKQAAKRRDLSRKMKEKTEEEMVKKYVNQIKLFKNRIKEMLDVEMLLIENKFDYLTLCTDCINHKIGFAKNKNGIGIYGGGACGEFDLIVNQNGIAIMIGKQIVRDPNYEDEWFLKRFVNEFPAFEERVNNFVKNL